ncbi:hypothetical protein ACFLYP_02475 [Chloroflexota bacterium]
MDESDLLIGIVGPCKSGKTVLKNGLAEHGYRCRHISQEHSFVPSMWQKISNPDILIYLEVSYQETLSRSFKWPEKDYHKQQRRLAHALQHADLIIDTDQSSIEETLQVSLNFLAQFD